jgi:hypothetical protein
MAIIIVVESKGKRLTKRGEEMKRLFVYITMVLLFSAGAVFAGDGGGYGAPPSGSGPQAQGVRPDPSGQNEGGPASGVEYGPKKPNPEGARSSYRQEGPNNPAGSRWRIEGGGFIEMDAGRRK